MTTTASAPRPRPPRQSRRPLTSFATCPVCGSRRLKPYRLRSVAIGHNRAGCISVTSEGVRCHEPGSEAAIGAIIQLEMECEAGHQSWTTWRTTGDMTHVEVAGSDFTGPVESNRPPDASPEERLLAVIRDKPTSRLDPSEYHLLVDLMPLVADAILSCGPHGGQVADLREEVDRELMRRGKRKSLAMRTIESWLGLSHAEAERLVAILADDLAYEGRVHADPSQGRYWMDGNQASYQSTDRDLRA